MTPSAADAGVLSDSSSFAGGDFAAPPLALSLPGPDLTGAGNANEGREAGDALLEAAMGEVNLDGLDAEALRQFEAGDAASVRRTLERPRGTVARGATAVGEAFEPGLEAEGAGPGAGAEAGPGTTASNAVVPGRISIKHLNAEQRGLVMAVLDRARQGQPLEEAARAVFGFGLLEDADAGGGGEESAGGAEAQDQAWEAQGQAHGAEVEGGAAPDGTEAAADTRVGALEARLAELRADYEARQLVYDPAATAVLEEMQDVKLDLREAQRQAHEETQQAQVFHSEVLASRERMAQENAAWLQNPVFMDFAEAEITLAENRSDPIMFTPDWPEKIASRVKAKYFSTQQPAAQSAEFPAGMWQGVPPAPRTRVRIPGSPTGDAYSAGAISTETALAEIGSLSSEQIDALLIETERRGNGRRGER